MVAVIPSILGVLFSPSPSPSLLRRGLPLPREWQTSGVGEGGRRLCPRAWRRRGNDVALVRRVELARRQARRQPQPADQRAANRMRQGASWANRGWLSSSAAGVSPRAAARGVRRSHAASAPPKRERGAQGGPGYLQRPPSVDGGPTSDGERAARGRPSRLGGRNKLVSRGGVSYMRWTLEPAGSVVARDQQGCGRQQLSGG